MNLKSEIMVLKYINLKYLHGYIQAYDKLYH